MNCISRTVCFGTLAAVLALGSCGGTDADPSSESPSTESEDALPMEEQPPNPEAVAAAEALIASLSDSELTLVPTVRGLVDIEYTQPIRRRGSRIVTTTMRVRNQSRHAIAGFEVSEVWYDSDANIVTGGQIRFREPILPQQVVDIQVEVPRDPDMVRSNTEFSHQNGDVRQSLVPELPDPVEEEEADDESAA